MIQPEQLAWAAGLFEGEGWFNTSNQKPSMGMQMSDYEVLQRFAEVMDCGRIYYRKPRVYDYEKINARKEQWAWRLSKKVDIIRIVTALYPWLSSRRQAKASEVLDTAKLIRDKAGMPKGHRTKRSATCGEVRRYWQGCRCDECRAANNSYSIEKKKIRLVSI
jgi:hypothetical protein